MSDDRHGVPDLKIPNASALQHPERIDGRCEGAAFSLRRGESNILKTRRGEVLVTYEGGHVSARFVREPDEPKAAQSVMSAEEWDDVHAYMIVVHHRETQTVSPEVSIAVSNDRLASFDPKKITRAKLDALRVILWNWEGEHAGEAAEELAFIDALEAYLRPRDGGDTPLHPDTFPGITPDLQKKLDKSL